VRLKTPISFLEVTPDDIGKYGADAACLLALVRYMAVDGWWRATHVEIGAYLGGISHDKIRRVVARLEASSKLLSQFVGTDRVKSYSTPDLSDVLLRGSACRPELEVREQRLREIASSEAGRSEQRLRDSACSLSCDYADLRPESSGVVKVTTLPSQTSFLLGLSLPWSGTVPTPATAKTDDAAKLDTAKGTRLPSEDWSPDERVKDELRAKYPNLKLGTILEEFRDYWLSVPGKDARKIDWNRTFRNRVREVADRPRYQRSPVIGDQLSTSDIRVLQGEALKVKLRAQRKALENGC
jgi:hypothetical protein